MPCEKNELDLLEFPYLSLIYCRICHEILKESFRLLLYILYLSYAVILIFFLFIILTAVTFLMEIKKVGGHLIWYMLTGREMHAVKTKYDTS